MARQVRRRRYLWVLLFVVAGIGIFFAIRAIRTEIWRASRFNRPKSVALALHNFHEIYKQFPQAVRRDKTGKPLSSWRFHIQPFVESIMVALDTRARWDDPMNQWLTDNRWELLERQKRQGIPERG